MVQLIPCTRLCCCSMPEELQLITTDIPSMENFVPASSAVLSLRSQFSCADSETLDIIAMSATPLSL